MEWGTPCSLLIAPVGRLPLHSALVISAVFDRDVNCRRAASVSLLFPCSPPLRPSGLHQPPVSTPGPSCPAGREVGLGEQGTTSLAFWEAPTPPGWVSLGQGGLGWGSQVL